MSMFENPNTNIPPDFISASDWYFDDAVRHPDEIVIDSPPSGVAEGDRVILIITGSFNAKVFSDGDFYNGGGVEHSAPGFTYVANGSFGAVPPSSIRVTYCRTYTARYSAGMFPLTVSCDIPVNEETGFASIGDYWKCAVAAWTPSFDIGDTDGEGTSNNEDYVPDSAVSVSVTDTATVVNISGLQVSNLEDVRIPNGFTEVARIDARDAAPEPRGFVGASMHYDPIDPFPESLTISSPPSGTQNGDELMIFLCSNYDTLGGSANFPRPDDNWTTFLGSSTGVTSTRGTITLRENYYRATMSDDIFPLTITPTTTTVLPVYGGWVAYIIAYDPSSRPYITNVDEGVTYTSETVPTDPLGYQEKSPYGTSVNFYVIGASTSLAIGDQPLFTGVYDRREFTEKIRFPRVNGRMGEAILFERKLGEATPANYSPIMSKWTNALGLSNKMLLYNTETPRGGGIVISQRQIENSGATTVTGPIYNKGAADGEDGFTQIFAMDDPEVDPTRGWIVGSVVGG